MSSRVFANQLTLSNVSLTASDASSDTIQIQFDLSWNNSWKTDDGHDAAWLFVKYSTDSGSTWNHATLKTDGTNPAGFSDGSGTSLNIVVPSDKKGAFLERSSNGSGSVSATSVQLVWDYAADGLLDSSTARVKVFGVEMVYVPSGAFAAGDGAISSAAFRQGSGDTDPWTVVGSGAISVTNAASNGYYYASGGNGGEAGSGSAFTIPSAFPKGYGAFYLMKQEITEGQWVDFFNTLSADQRTVRDLTNGSGKSSDDPVSRNTIAWTSGDAETVRSDRACGFLSWMDLCAYADWAALRPMTELEYEKAARGAGQAAGGEYAWGGTSATPVETLSGSEDGTETASTPDANVNDSNTALSGGDGDTGPVRAGIFATATSTRGQAGAGYYGATELSGNLNEWVVTVGNATGRAFSGTHGDGALTTIASYEGNATNTDWPGLDGTAARGITGAEGAGVRGGGYASATARGRISDRASAVNDDSGRNGDFGGRCARSAS